MSFMRVLNQKLIENKEAIPKQVNLHRGGHSHQLALGKQQLCT